MFLPRLGGREEPLYSVLTSCETDGEKLDVGADGTALGLKMGQLGEGWG